jgi:hypothetical protein
MLGEANYAYLYCYLVAGETFSSADSVDQFSIVENHVFNNGFLLEQRKAHGFFDPSKSHLP